MRNLRRNLRPIVLATLTLLVTGCVPVPATTVTLPAPPPATLRAPLPAATVATPAEKAVSVEYDLGETTVTQARFPEDSRFRNMPVRLNGLLAAPGGQGPFPVIVILHGTHPGCPEIDHVDRWPCDPADEQPNYRGFAYLAERLAAAGYVALSINVNAENTFGFGEPTPGERLGQIVDKHLQALAVASAGGENGFGLDLEGKADMRRLAFAGHSRGGDMAYLLAKSPEMAARAAAPNGYGPIAGILMVAPSPGFVDPADGSPVPLSIVLPMCDGDVINLEGQHFYEGARLASAQQAWVTSSFVEAANHNFFNSTLGDDPFGRQGRPDCDPLLEPEVQQAFLGNYAVDFFATLFGGARGGAGAAKAPEGPAKARLGMDSTMPAPSELYGRAARVAVLPAADQRTSIFTPASARELVTNRLGGAVTAEGMSTFFCEAGYYTPLSRPGTEPCRRASVVIPGDPALVVVNWDRPGAALRFEIPERKGNLSRASAITLRAAVDPLSELNAPGQGQAFSIRLTDGTGRTATAAVSPDEPALRYPTGETVADASFGQVFTGRVPLTTVRVPMSAVGGIDKTDIREVSLLFDRTPSGALFLADLEWVQ
jgi:dienelactone hydrolase